MDARGEERCHIARLCPQRCFASIPFLLLWSRSILRSHWAGLAKDLTACFCAWCLYVGTPTSLSTQTRISFALNPFSFLKEPTALLG